MDTELIQAPGLTKRCDDTAALDVLDVWGSAGQAFGVVESDAGAPVAGRLRIDRSRVAEGRP